jgi:hypothetical protein
VTANTAAVIDAFIVSPQGTNPNGREVCKDILTFSRSDKKVTVDLPDLQPFLCALVSVSATRRIERRGRLPLIYSKS